MNKSFHYDHIYKLALHTGFENYQAHRIAFASQFVDDNSVPLNWNGYNNYISQTMDILNPSKLYEKVYSKFHYPECGVNAPFKEKLYEGVNPRAVKAGLYPLQNARRLRVTNDLNALGIFLHTYADSFAHHGFSAYWEPWNGFPGALSAIIPNIGHADAKHNPDIEGKIWDDPRNKDEFRQINNVLRFSQASLRCQELLMKVSRKKKVVPLKGKLKNLIPYNKKDILKDFKWWVKFQDEIKRVFDEE